MTAPSLPKRSLALDAMRGWIMVLLALEATGLYEHLATAGSGTIMAAPLEQLFHHPWNGLRFWDLIQPAFMFMSGTALAYSLHSQKQKGMSWGDSFKKVLKRSGWLFFWGVLDYAVRKTGLSFELWDVLTQLSFTTLVAFLIFQFSIRNQILISIGLLLLTEALYRFTNIPGFDQPFTDQHNFGNFMDWILMRKINQGGWVAINCIPTAVHTIAGAVCGKLLLQDESKALKQFAIAGIVCLIVGFSLDWAHITPIIKRIATSSFTVASLGWCLLIMVFFYWWIDIKGHNKYLLFVQVVGMNSLFIYLFFEIVGHRWFTGYVSFIGTELLSYIHTPQLLAAVLASLLVFALEWGMLYFLYQKRIFFRV